jgi:hypoxanthine-DNA glycosylase
MNRTPKPAGQVHTIPPVYNSESRLLILGSFPSVKSREQGFFYGHPQNRFWRVVSAVFGCDTLSDTAEKRAFLLNHGIALWDVIASCEISGSSDSSIRSVRANDIRPILSESGIRRIFVNGRTAERLYRRYIFPQTGIEAVCLPSTSPANAGWSFERLCGEWRIIAGE